MELFKVSEGPWEKLFEGTFQGENELKVYSNDKSVLMVVIFEKQDKKVVGAVAELYKVFFAQGELEAFVESLPRELIFITKHSEKENSKFMLIGSNPVYMEWKEDTVIQETDRLLKKIQTSSGIITDISKGYDITLQELHVTKPNIKKAFFSMPLLVPIIATNYQETQMLSETMPVSFHEFYVGMTREKSKLIEPITMFSKTIVIGGSKEERHHALHLLSEAYMLSGAPAVIFDFDHSFEGLKNPNPNTDEIKKYEIESEPIGFPIRTFLPTTDLKIDLNMTDPFGFGQAFGFGKSKSVEIIANVLMKSGGAGIKDLLQKLNEAKEGEVSDYEINRTARILLLLDKLYPGFFDGTNLAQELGTKKVKSLGRGAILDLSTLDERARLVLMHNVISSLTSFFKGAEKQTGLKTIIVMPDAKNVFNDKISDILSKDNISMITQFEKFGMGYVLSNETEIDFPQALTQNSEALISFVQGNDCAIQLKGRKSYRVLLRPTLSSGGKVQEAVVGKK